MLVKLNKKNSHGQELYQEVFMGTLTQGCVKTYGSVGTLDQLRQNQMPSIRFESRHPEDGKVHVKTNRKSRRSRDVFYVPRPIKDKKGGIIGYSASTVKHIQESNNALKRKSALVEFNEKIAIAKGKFYKAHPEFRAGNS